MERIRSRSTKRAPAGPPSSVPPELAHALHAFLKSKSISDHGEWPFENTGRDKVNVKHEAARSDKPRVVAATTTVKRGGSSTPAAPSAPTRTTLGKPKSLPVGWISYVEVLRRRCSNAVVKDLVFAKKWGVLLRGYVVEFLQSKGRERPDVNAYGVPMHMAEELGEYMKARALNERGQWPFGGPNGGSTIDPLSRIPPDSDPPALSFLPPKTSPPPSPDVFIKLETSDWVSFYTMLKRKCGGLARDNMTKHTWKCLQRHTVRFLFKRGYGRIKGSSVPPDLTNDLYDFLKAETLKRNRPWPFESSVGADTLPNVVPDAGKTPDAEMSTSAEETVVTGSSATAESSMPAVKADTQQAGGVQASYSTPSSSVIVSGRGVLSISSGAST